MRGRFPQPDGLKDRRGNPGKRALDAADAGAPAPRDGEVIGPPPSIDALMPLWLTQPREQEIFRKIMGVFIPAQVARETDVNAYARYAVAMAKYIRAKEWLESPEEGEAENKGWVLIESKHGTRWARHPAAQDLLDWGQEATRAELQLGLTPLSRQSILRGLGALRGLGGDTPPGELPLDNGEAPAPASANDQRSPLGFLKVVKTDKAAG